MNFGIKGIKFFNDCLPKNFIKGSVKQWITFRNFVNGYGYWRKQFSFKYYYKIKIQQSTLVV